MWSAMLSTVLIGTKGSASSVQTLRMKISPGTLSGTQHREHVENLEETVLGVFGHFLTLGVQKPKGGRAVRISMPLYFHGNSAGRRFAIHSDILAPTRGLDDLPLYEHTRSVPTLQIHGYTLPRWKAAKMVVSDLPPEVVAAMTAADETTEEGIGKQVTGRPLAALSQPKSADSEGRWQSTSFSPRRWKMKRTMSMSQQNELRVL